MPNELEELKSALQLITLDPVRWTVYWPLEELNQHMLNIGITLNELNGTTYRTARDRSLEIIAGHLISK